MIDQLMTHFKVGKHQNVQQIGDNSKQALKMNINKFNEQIYL